MARLSVQEVSVHPIAALGSGLNISVSFSPSTYKAATIAGPLIGGCSAYEYSPAELAAEPGLDEGVVQLTHIPDGKRAELVFPPCAFVPGEGYLCMTAPGQGAATITPGTGFGEGGNGIPEGAALVQIEGADFSTDVEGRYLSLSGLESGNNGEFPIIIYNPLADGVIIGNQGASGESGTTATYFTIAGAGPIPNADPENPRDWLANGDGLTVALTAPASGGHFASFSKTFATGAGVGDSFTLDTASRNLILGLPDDGSEFSISCDGEGGDCGTATGSVLTLLSSDGDITGLPPYFMPSVVTKRVSVTCTKISGTDHTLTVEANISALLAASNPTRIRTTYLRSNLQSSSSINIIAGHGVIGFSPFVTAQ